MKKLLLLIAILLPSAFFSTHANASITVSKSSSCATSGTQYVAYGGCTLTASGGTAPYTYSWSTSSSYASIPEGLTINASTGVISGTIYGQGGYVTEFVAKDSTGATGTTTITFAIAGNNTLGGCSLFPSNSAFHINVSSLPVDTSPAAAIYSSYQSSSIKPFFGGDAVSNIPNGIPFLIVPYSQADVSIKTTLYQSYFTSGPFPSYAPIEATSNDAAGGSDNHTLIVQSAGGSSPYCQLWEMWQGIPPYASGAANGAWSDSSNAYWSNIGASGTNAMAMLPQGNGSTDAAGLPVAPLLVNADEVIGSGTPSAPAGSVQHPVRFTVNNMLARYVWPATATAGVGSCSGGYSDSNGMLLQSAPPTSCTMPGAAGEIYRLKASVATPSCASSSPQSAIIIQGFRNYGIILADNGSTGGLIGTPDSRWNDNDLTCLSSLTLGDFEPVNVSGVAADLTANYNGSGHSAPVTTYRTTAAAPTTYTLSTATAGTGSGTISGSSCAGSYAAGTAWSCSATASSGSTLTGISDTCGGAVSGSTDSGKMPSSNCTVTATFTAAAATLSSIAVTPATASILPLGTQQFTATCSYSNSTTSNCTSTVTWSSSSTGAVTISVAGLALGVTAGTSTIQATSGSISGSATLTVTNPAPTLTSISVTPATASIVSGTGTQQYAATCTYSDSTTSTCTSTVTWSSSSTAAATISSAGLATGVAAGSSTIKATSGSVSGTAALTVTSPTMTGISVTPATASIVAGTGTQQFTATCSYSNNTTSNCTSTVTWSSTNTAAATVSSAGKATGVAAGTTTIQATSGSLSATGALTVTAPTLSSIAVTPATASIVAGTGTQQFTATCTYSNSTTSNCSSSVAWSSSNTAAATISSAGLATGVAAGSANITATSGGTSGSATLTVTGPTVTSIAVSPATASIVAGMGTQQYTATCTYSNSTTSNCSSTVTWSSSNTAAATIASNGLATGVAVGTATIKATSGSVSGTGTLTVSNPALTGISLSPATASLVAGTGTQQLTATCSYANNTTANCTSTVTWSSSNTAAATVSNTGLATGVAAGSSTITAVSGSMSATSVLTVTSATLTSIAVSPATPTLTAGSGTQQFTATCNYSNNTNSNCTSTVTWSSSNTAAATISAAGAAAGVAAGTSTIKATSGSVSGSSVLTVTAASLTSIAVTPATASIVAGTGTQQYTATCSYSNNTTANCTSTVTWSSNNTAAATAASSGLVTGVAAGNATVAATLNGVSGSAALTVTSPSLSSIALSPATASVAAGTGTQQYTATCSYANHTTSNCSATVTWSSSNASIATVNSAGLATGVAAGSSTITATSGSTKATSTLTVTAATLTGISLSPATATIASGTGTQQYAANCSYSNSTSANCTSSVTWSSSNAAAATINASGLATGVAAGSSTITATSGSTKATSTLTVTAATLTGISLSPATATIPAGTGTQQYAATCSYSNSTSANCTSSVAWSSSNTAAATINGSGLATGVAAGTSTITATSGGKSATGSLTVNSPSLSSIHVTPSTASISAAAGTQQYAASCTYSDASVSTCTSTVTWSSSNNVYATISASGLATGVSAGTVTITATSGSTSGSSTLTVEASTPPASVHRGKWSWMDGSSSSGGTLKAIPGVMAELNTPSASNTPGGRDGSVTWTDQGGNLWLFGGGGFDASGNSGYLNDLWEFTPTTMEWAWVGGSSTVPAANQGRSGVYSTVGSASTEAIPGGRQASVSWTDASGNLWLFGGEGFDSSGVNGDLNDLWKYAPSSQEWTWVGGSSTVPAAGKGRAGVYGTLGAPAQANIPGGRWGANSWTDANGNLWLFGGVGFDSTGASGSLNDLWQFNASTAQWAWMAGSSTVGSNGGQYGVYGTLGTAASGNTPSSRNQAVTWTDQSGNLWLFGGYGFDSTGTWGYLNDLWQFNLSSHQWAWMGGSNTVGCAGCGQAGVYGTVGTRDSSSQPGGRNQAVGWSDSSGNLWMFGGVGFDSKGVNGDLNDLWEYVLSSGEWAWVGGSGTVPASGKGQPGSYGSRGVPANSDNPGGRWSSGAWTDPKGDLWLFGGAGYDANGNYDNLNDLWVYQPDPGTLATATPTLSIGSGTYTGAQSITIADQIPGATIYYTTDGTAPTTGSAVYTGPITVGSAETLQAIALASGYGPSGLASANYTIVAPFSLGLGTGASSITVYPGGTANFNLILTPVGGNTFPAAITFTATGLPPGATATFSPSTVNAGSGLTGVTFAVQTQSEGPAAAMLHQPGKAGSLNTGTLSGLLCLLFLPLAAVARWRKTAKHLARHASLMIWLLILAGITAAVTGCGGGAALNSNAVAAPAASYNITITAKSGALQQSAKVTLTIQ